jgi:nucleoside-diphosphate-sugar epimerase
MKILFIGATGTIGAAVARALVAMKMDPGSGVPAARVATTYVKCVEGASTGQVLDALAS